jgi:hypothetical protein
MDYSIYCHDVREETESIHNSVHIVSLVFNIANDDLIQEGKPTV